MSKPIKKINFKDRLTDDYLDLSMCELEIVPIKEIVSSQQNTDILPSDANVNAYM